MLGANDKHFNVQHRTETEIKWSEIDGNDKVSYDGFFYIVQDFQKKTHMRDTFSPEIFIGHLTEWYIFHVCDNNVRHQKDYDDVERLQKDAEACTDDRLQIKAVSTLSDHKHGQPGYNQPDNY